MVKRIHAIRKLPLSDLNNDDIAMMLRQKFSLDYIVPLACDKLQSDMLAHGISDEEGAIMEAILKIPHDFWTSNLNYRSIIKNLLDNNKTLWTFKNRENFESVKK